MPESAQCPFGQTYKTKHKPTYASLIALAIKASPGQRLMLNDVYAFVEAHRSLVPTASHPNWKNSVRHNLSLRSCFKKVPRWDSSGKKLSAYWELDSSKLPPAAATALAQIERSHGVVPHFDFPTQCADDASSTIESDSDEDEVKRTQRLPRATAPPWIRGARANGASLNPTPESSDVESERATTPTLTGGAPQSPRTTASRGCPYSGSMYPSGGRRIRAVAKHGHGAGAKMQPNQSHIRPSSSTSSACPYTGRIYQSHMAPHHHQDSSELELAMHTQSIASILYHRQQQMLHASRNSSLYDGPTYSSPMMTTKSGMYTSTPTPPHSPAHLSGFHMPARREAPHSSDSESDDEYDRDYSSPTAPMSTPVDHKSHNLSGIALLAAAAAAFN